MAVNSRSRATSSTSLEQALETLCDAIDNNEVSRLVAAHSAVSEACDAEPEALLPAPLWRDLALRASRTDARNSEVWLQALAELVSNSPARQDQAAGCRPVVAALMQRMAAAGAPSEEYSAALFALQAIASSPQGTPAILSLAPRAEALLAALLRAVAAQADCTAKIVMQGQPSNPQLSVACAMNQKTAITSMLMLLADLSQADHALRRAAVRDRAVVGVVCAALRGTEPFVRMAALTMAASLAQEPGTALAQVAGMPPGPCELASGSIAAAAVAVATAAAAAAAESEPPAADMATEACAASCLPVAVAQAFRRASGANEETLALQLLHSLALPGAVGSESSMCAHCRVWAI
jgi:hypothetical protein